MGVKMKETGGPAFAAAVLVSCPKEIVEKAKMATERVKNLTQACGVFDGVFQEGMTLRDYFAGQALVGILAGRFWEVVSISDCPEACAYRMADAMLAERAKE